jgi:hypothetical protein
MAILTAQAIEGYKKHTERTIQRARYRIGSAFYDAPIHRRERMPDGRVAIYFSITPGTSGSVTIREVQLLDTSNSVWASKVEDIALGGAQEGVLYRFAFDFKEV